jgi:hypothetical protein
MRKLAHIRLPGHGLRTWDSPRYFTPGVSPSHSIYDHPEMVSDDGFYNAEIRAGFVEQRERVQLTNPTLTRQGRIGAQFSSLAAAQIFQGGWATSWAHLQPMRVAIEEGRQLNTNFNPNAPGRAEQQRATIYNPWPSAGALYPKAI